MRYNPNSDNGGFAGYQQPSDQYASENNAVCYGYAAGSPATYCNTLAYVERVNAGGWCGASDWRLPTKEELLSLVNFAQINLPSGNPLIDTAYFPNTVSGWFWSSTPAVSDASGSTISGGWFVDFGNDGSDGGNAGSDYYPVRLIRHGCNPNDPFCL